MDIEKLHQLIVIKQKRAKLRKDTRKSLQISELERKISEEMKRKEKNGEICISDLKKKKCDETKKTKMLQRKLESAIIVKNVLEKFIKGYAGLRATQLIVAELCNYKVNRSTPRHRSFMHTIPGRALFEGCQEEDEEIEDLF